MWLRLRDLLYKLISVKGLFFVVSLVLTFWFTLEPIYSWIAGAVWVGSREFYKFYTVGKGVDTNKTTP